MGKQNKDTNPMSSIFSLQIHFNLTPAFLSTINQMYATASYIVVSGKIRCLLFNTLPYTKQTNAHTALNKQEIQNKVSQFCLGEEMGGKTTGRKRQVYLEFII